MCFLCIDVSACDRRVLLHTCLWRGCRRTLLGMCLFFSMLSLCEFACVYVHRCMWHICLLSLCLCECVHTCVWRACWGHSSADERNAGSNARGSSSTLPLLPPCYLRHMQFSKHKHKHKHIHYTYVKTSTHTQTQTSRFTYYVLTHTQAQFNTPAS